MAVVGRERELAAMFCRSWTLDELRSVDPSLYDDLKEQEAMFHQEIQTGDNATITEHGEAMCRGWAIAIQRMSIAQVQGLWPGAVVTAVRVKPVEGVSDDCDLSEGA